VNGAKITDTLKQITHDSQKTNVNTSRGKKLAIKRETETAPKCQPACVLCKLKMNRYQPSKPMPNSFEGLEEELDDMNINVSGKDS